MHKRALTLVELLVLLAIFVIIGSLLWTAAINHEKTTQKIEMQKIEFKDTKILPPNATNIKPLSEYWCYFDLDGRTFLVFVTNSGHMALTEVSKIEASKLTVEKEK